MGDMKKKIDDWMVRISFAEADADVEGFRATGVDVDRKTTLALDRLRIVRGEIHPGQTTEAGMEISEGAEMPQGQDLSVMIVDDEPIVGKRLKPALEKSGFVVEYYEHPSAAVDRLNEKQFDIIVTDLRMEGLDGIQILEHVMEHCDHTRVILITGYATVEVAREALVKGAFDFISKPFKARDLKAVINKAALSLGHTAIT
jgi:CheY-like chemotaxis protein